MRIRQATVRNASSPASVPSPSLMPMRGFGTPGEAESFAPGNRGWSLPQPVRRQVEAATGADLSSVRIHLNHKPGRIGAKAFTQGEHVTFEPEEYRPETPAGRHVLAHELAHVLQQRAGRAESPSGSPFDTSPQLEAEADAFGERVTGAAEPLPSALRTAVPPRTSSTEATSASAPVQAFWERVGGQVRWVPGGPDPEVHQNTGETQWQYRYLPRFLNQQLPIYERRAREAPAPTFTRKQLIALADRDRKQRFKEETTRQREEKQRLEEEAARQREEKQRREEEAARRAAALEESRQAPWMKKHPETDLYPRLNAAPGAGPALTRHHIIPKDTLMNFYNELHRNNHLEVLDPLMSRVVENQYASPQFQEQSEAREVTPGDLMNEWASLRQGAQPENRVAAQTLAQMYQWHPGNIVEGPSNRSDDPRRGDRLEEHADQLIGHRKFQHHQEAFNGMMEYLRQPDLTKARQAAQSLRKTVQAKPYPYEPERWEGPDAGGLYRIRR